MRQLYEKSGASSRFSDFAIDVRKVIEVDSLPEYTAQIHKNEEGMKSSISSSETIWP